MEKPLYKYLQRKYLEEFFRKGSLKIGTLYEYRDVEAYGNVIGDKTEGLHVTEFSLAGGGEVDLATTLPEAEFFRKFVLAPEQQHLKPKIVLADGARLMAHSSSPDLYIYCMTERYDRAVMEEFGCDACIEIMRPTAFFSAISHRIRHKGQFGGFGAMKYENKTAHYLEPHQLHPATTKDKQYEYQREWRAIWTPTGAPRMPIFVDVPRAVRHCREYVLHRADKPASHRL